MRPLLYIFLLAGCLKKTSVAQDLHWSQASSALLYQNPAFTGISAKYSASLNYRNQWSILNQPYASYVLNADTRLSKTSKGASLNVGVIMLQDVTAGGNYKSTAAGLCISSLIKLNKVFDFGAGLGVNFQQNKIQSKNYAWGKQFDGQEYNASLSSGETYSAASRSFADLSAGIVTRYNKKGRSRFSAYQNRFILAYSAAHVNKPGNSIYGTNEKLNIKHSFYFMGQFEFQSDVALKPFIQFNSQGKMMVFTGGGLFRYSYNQHTKKTEAKKESAISLGCVYRYNDAVAPILEFETSTWIIGVSYDATTSGLSNHNQLRGGMEISLRLKASDWFWGKTN